MHGDPVVGKHGVVLMQRGGIDGVATFDAHPSAGRAMPERITYLCKQTVLAATVVVEETYEGELALAMRVASAGFVKD